MTQKGFIQVSVARWTVFLMILGLGCLVGVPSVFAKGGPPYVVALSNSYIGNNWRAQMAADLERAIADLQARGLVSKYIPAHANNNVSQQISHIRSILTQNPDLLLINAASDTALNPIIKQAVDQGVTVVTFDARVSSPYVTQVLVNFPRYGQLMGSYIARRLNGSGNIVSIRGVAGNPIDEEIWQGTKQVLDNYPGIRVISTIFADWDQAKSQQLMAPVIASGQRIDAVITQGGEAWGAARAFQAAGRPIPPIVAGGTVGFIKLWRELRASTGYSTIDIGNPPFLGTFALYVGLMLLQGEQTPRVVYPPLYVIVDSDSAKLLEGEDSRYYYLFDLNSKQVDDFVAQPENNRFDVWMTFEQVRDLVRSLR